MNAQELFLLNPTQVKLKAKGASSSKPKDGAGQNNLTPVATANSNEKTSTSAFKGHAEELIRQTNEQVTQPNSSVNTRTHSAPKKGQNNLEPTHIKRCRQAIRSFCLECQGRLSHAVEACEDYDCKLYPFRKLAVEDMDFAQKTEQKPLRAVRQHCLICCGGERDEVRNCAAGKTCTLWPFRFGVSPAIYLKVKEKWRGPKHYTLPGL